MLDVEADTVLLRVTLCVLELHTVGVEVTETVEEPDTDSEPVLQGEGVRVLQELADWESVPEVVSVPVPHAVELTVVQELTE